jgi:hypothetical protein
VALPMPGVYPVVIYDGVEGGAHYTWDLFTVTRSEPAGRTQRAWLTVTLLAILAVALWLIRRLSIRDGLTERLGSSR